LRIACLALRALAPKARAFERSTLNPMKAQKALLMEYLSKNRSTEYGKKYHFSDVRSVADYQMLVPMSDSESIYPYVEKIVKGARSVLTKDKVVFFGLTSGTTGKPKLIPVTKFSRAKKSETLDLWAYYILRDHPGVLDGKILAIINPEDEAFTLMAYRTARRAGTRIRTCPP
jgi:hypothetical protein